MHFLVSLRADTSRRLLPQNKGRKHTNSITAAGMDTMESSYTPRVLEQFRSLTCVQVSQVRVLDVRVLLLQVVPELHGDVGPVVTFGAVVHLDALVLTGVQNVFADILSTV